MRETKARFTEDGFGRLRLALLGSKALGVVWWVVRVGGGYVRTLSNGVQYQAEDLEGADLFESLDEANECSRLVDGSFVVRVEALVRLTRIRESSVLKDS